MEEQLLGLHLAVAEGPLEGLDHQGGTHPRIERPAHHTAAEQVDPHRQVPPADSGADVGDVARPAAIWGRLLEVLLQQVLRHPRAPAPALVAGLESWAIKTCIRF